MKKFNWTGQKAQVAVFEESFYQSLRLFLCICTCFCAAPGAMSYHSLSRAELKLKKWGKSKVIMHLIWGVIVLASITTSTYFQYSEYDTDKTSFITRVLYVTEYIIDIFNSAIIIFGCYYQRHWYVLYFRKCSEIFSTLQQLGGEVEFKNLQIFLTRSLTAYGIFFSIVFVTDFMYNRMDAKEFFRSSTVFSIPNIITVLALTEYFVLLIILRDCYRTINQILGKLPSQYNWKLLDRAYNGQKKTNTIFDLIARSSYFKHSNLNGVEPNSCESTRMILEKLRRLCLNLTELNKDINGSFGILVISVIISTFPFLSTQFYIFYKLAEGLDKNDAWLYIYSVLWLILHGGKSFLILLFCNWVNTEVSVFKAFNSLDIIE